MNLRTISVLCVFFISSFALCRAEDELTIVEHVIGKQKDLKREILGNMHLKGVFHKISPNGETLDKVPFEFWSSDDEYFRLDKFSGEGGRLVTRVIVTPEGYMNFSEGDRGLMVSKAGPVSDGERYLQTDLGLGAYQCSISSASSPAHKRLASLYEEAKAGQDIRFDIIEGSEELKVVAGHGGRPEYEFVVAPHRGMSMLSYKVLPQKTDDATASTQWSYSDDGSKVPKEVKFQLIGPDEILQRRVLTIDEVKLSPQDVEIFSFKSGGVGEVTSRGLRNRIIIGCIGVGCILAYVGYRRFIAKSTG